ncbi:hypothetical protein [Nonomuraea sp. NPDC048901]|uniref:hypothetical protein n=1 Tax=unclassified Nonomuraea TaxID=2593643 RepID=UPI0033CD72FE
MSMRRAFSLAAAGLAAGAALTVPAGAAHAAPAKWVTGTFKACTYEVPMVSAQGDCKTINVNTVIQPGEVQAYFLDTHSRPVYSPGYLGTFGLRLGVTAAQQAYVQVAIKKLYWLDTGIQLKVSPYPDLVGNVIAIEPTADFSDFAVNTFCGNAPTTNCSRTILDVSLRAT